MKNLLNALALVVLVGGGLYLYRTFFTVDPAVVIDSIEHELAATKEFVFSRDNMKFTETRNHKKFLAHIDLLYTWQANVPFGFTPDKMDLEYDADAKKLTVTVHELQLFPFSIHSMKSKKTSEFAWLNQGEPVKNFWEQIDSHTRKLINDEFTNKQNGKAQIESIRNITHNSMKVTILDMLKKLDLHEIEVAVIVKSVKLYGNKKLTLA